MRSDFDSTRRVYCLLCLLLVSQFSFGCGGPVMAPVKGVVTVNGKPVEGAEVCFKVKDASQASVGLTNDKGEYELTTFNTNDGAIVGENLVAIRQIPKDVASMSSAGPSPEEMKSGKSDFRGVSRSMEKAIKNSNGVIPMKYANAEKSGLKRTVGLGDKNKNNFNFDLKP